VPDDYRTYVDKMARDGIWGDHLTLQAAADAYGVRINIITRCVLRTAAERAGYCGVVAVTTRTHACVGKRQQLIWCMWGAGAVIPSRF
jgi:cyanophycinase-like exopeptidase